MNLGPEIWHALVIAFAAVFTGNIILTLFLGLCPFLAVSREVKTATGLGLAVVFVMTCTIVLDWLAYHYVLVPFKLEFFRFILFIVIIAAFVQFVEMVIERYSMALYQNLGIFLPLITVNCSILGASLFMVVRGYSLIETIGFGFGSGVGWLLAIVSMAGIRRKLQNKYIPESLQGPAITMIIAGIMALAFIGFTGVLQGQ
jgi:Na+-transporting NADH:ubiquinone oxidoreductase subunit E